MKRPTGAIATRQELQELIDKAKHEEVFLYAAGIYYDEPTKFMINDHTEIFKHYKEPGYILSSVLQLKPVKSWEDLSLDALNIDTKRSFAIQFLFTNYWFALRYNLIINVRHEARIPF
jgi:hypothetical protein